MGLAGEGRMTIDDPRLGYKEVVDKLHEIDTSLGCICIAIGALAVVVGIVGYYIIKGLGDL